MPCESARWPTTTIQMAIVVMMMAVEMHKRVHNHCHCDSRGRQIIIGLLMRLPMQIRMLPRKAFQIEMAMLPSPIQMASVIDDHNHNLHLLLLLLRLLMLVMMMMMLCL